MRIAFFCIAFVFFVSCSKKDPEDIIKPEKMQAVLWDIIKADVLSSNHTKQDSANAVRQNVALQKKIFQLHGVTREQYYKSFDYYTEHPGVLTVIIDSILAKDSRNKAKPNINIITDL